MAFSSNGQFVATGNRDGTLALWDPATGRLDSHITGSSSGGAHTSPPLGPGKWGRIGRAGRSSKAEVRSLVAERSAVVFRPDGLLLDIAGRYWNVTTAGCR